MNNETYKINTLADRLAEDLKEAEFKVRQLRKKKEMCWLLAVDDEFRQDIREIFHPSY